MKSNYKRLEPYIEFIDSRAIDHNSILDLDSIRGISSISKDFIKTRANLVGVVADKYKVVESGFFAYNPNTARMGDKIPIALNLFNYPVLVSSIYPTFKIKDFNELHPEYLMMWFRRPEFDRYARFMSHGSAREVFDIEEMNEIKLPIPTITKQREIVKEYNVIQNRIVLNQQLIQKLEQKAQAIYKAWFVDFEFPDGNGKPYKSNGGEMVWNQELQKEIPLGWEVGILKDVLECNPETLSINDNFSSILYLDTSNITNNRINELQELNLDTDEIPSRARRKVKDNDIIYSTVRPALRHYGIIKNLPENLIVSTGFAVFRMKYSNLSSELIYSFLTDEKTITFLQAKAEMSVSTYPSVTSDDIMNLDFVIPSEEVLNMTKEIFKSKDDFINLKNKENQKLAELKNLLLSKLATIEN